MHSQSHSRSTHSPINGTDIEALADGPHVLNEDPEADLVLPDLEDETRAVVEKTEDPGIDSLRGTFGTVGTIIRARKRATALSQARSSRMRTSSNGNMDDLRADSCGTDAAVKEGGDTEKTEFKREVLTGATVVNGNGRGFVASPLSTQGSLEGRRTASVRFTGSESAPITLEQSDQEGGDPMAQAGAAVEEAARQRAQTLPTILGAERTGADMVFLNIHEHV